LFYKRLPKLNSFTLVETAYKLMLGREAENPQVVKSKANLSTEDLRNEFVNSYEFRILNRARLSPVFEPTQADINQDSLANTFLHKTISQWTSLGESKPFWSVISSDENLGMMNDALKAEFYSSGVKNIEDFLQLLNLRNIDAGKLNRVLELGCGVGRLTKTLAEKFESVHALDISPGNIQIARNTLQEYKNIDFQILDSLDSITSLNGEFDVFVSLITLQHNPPAVQKLLLKSIFGKLKGSSCIAYFQTVTYIANQNDNKNDLNSSPKDFDTYALPMHEVLEIINEFNLKIFEIHRDDWQLDPDFHSYSFYLKR
jgi:2-polyprenyl-3-methyl-5-hydroxy-6-metoxy-1,4-benzoquinol methylase